MKTRMLPLAVLAGFLLTDPGCSRQTPKHASAPAAPGVDFRAEMRRLAIEISSRAKQAKPQFVVIPQNGHTLLSLSVDGPTPVAREYLAALDGVGQEDLFYGLEKCDQPTPAPERKYLLDYLKIAQTAGKPILVIDYCTGTARTDDSYGKNQALGFVSFAADRRELDDIPRYPAKPFRENSADVTRLNQAKNFLYLVDPEKYAAKADMIKALAQTNYDLIVVDAFFGEENLSSAEVARLKKKANGGQRLVLAYMSIGEAENYRWYWQKAWDANPPAFLDQANPEWPGCYKVKYWDPAWQNLIYAGPHSYLEQILQSNFDGVYLDLLDAFEYYEAKP